MRFPLGAPHGARSLGVQLYVYLADPGGLGDWDGAHTLIVKRLTSGWKEHKVNWSNKPSHVITNQATVEIFDGTDGQEIAFDITDMIQNVLSGAPHHGYEISVDSNGSKRLYSAETTVDGMKPKIELVWGGTPLPPTDLRPLGGAVVSDPTPRLLWTFMDPHGHDPQSAFQVQVDPRPGFATSGALFDSGYQDGPDTQYDLGEASGFDALTEGEVRYWRVKVRSAEGLWSEWSDVVAFEYRALGTLTLISPTDTVEETTPPVTWTVDGTVQKEVELWLYEFGRPGHIGGFGEDFGEDYGGGGYIEIWHSSREATTDTVRRWPHGLVRHLWSNAYKVRLAVWDHRDRLALPGAPARMMAEQVFSFVESTPDPVDTLTVTSADMSLTLHWTYTHTQPDFWGIKVGPTATWPADAEYIDDRLGPLDPFVSGTSYRWGIHPKPDEDITVEVVAIVKDGGIHKHSTDNPTVATSFRPVGIWFKDLHTNDELQLLDTQSPQLAIGRSGADFFPVNRRESISIVDAVRGYEGTVSGMIFGNDARDILESFAGNLPARRYRMVWINQSITVELGQISNLVPVQGGDEPGWSVTLQFRQVDDFLHLSS